MFKALNPCLPLEQLHRAFDMVEIMIYAAGIQLVGYETNIE